MHWFRKAAEQEHLWAQHNLGVLYEKGKGVKPDLAEAYKWYNLAAVHGLTYAEEARAALLTRISPEDLAEGQRRSTAFFRRPPPKPVAPVE